MDMPISQINSRLFAQLPPDPGMGLLFAVGTVSQIIYASGEKPIQFTLRYAGYALRCKVAPSVVTSFKLSEGQQVRATGHLSFSAQSAQFHLVVRDLEPLSYPDLPELDTPPPKTTAPSERTLIPDWLQAIQRRAQATAASQLEMADIPDWVQALAPPGATQLSSPKMEFSWGKERVAAILEPDPDLLQPPELTRLEENEQLLAHLMDMLERSESEDLELTPELLGQFSSAPGGEKAQAPPPEPPISLAPPSEPLPTEESQPTGLSQSIDLTELPTHPPKRQASDAPSPSSSEGIIARHRHLIIALLFILGAISVLVLMLIQLGVF